MLLLVVIITQGIKSCSHMFGRNGFKRLMEFLIGQTAAAGNEQVWICIFSYYSQFSVNV